MAHDTKTPERECVLIGVASPYVYEVYESLLRDSWRVAAFIDNQDKSQGPAELGPLHNLDEAPATLRALPALIPLLTPGHRKAISMQCRAAGFTHFPAHSDPSSIVASTASLGSGVLINAAATIGALSRLGEFVIVNRAASVGHHVVLEDFATLGPGCILCGSASIGQGTFIGAGAIINPKITIGANSVIGAGAVVVRDVEAGSVVVGNPARVVKTGQRGYNDVPV